MTASMSGRRRALDRLGRGMVDRSIASVSGTARVRVTMPVRWRIHSSLESMGPTRSSLGTAFSPRAAP
jgi:hypothetical protein